MSNTNGHSFWEQPGMGEKMEKNHRVAVESLLNRIRLDQSGTVLDVGCGNGWLLRKISPNIGYGIGVDQSTAMIEEAQRLRGDLGNLEYRVDKWANIANYPGNSFGLVLSVESIYWSPVQENLNQIYRILKSGGSLGLTVEYYKENKDCQGWPEQVGVPMQLHSTREYAKTLQKAGFKNVVISKSLDTKDLEGTSEAFRYKYGTLVITALK